MRKTVATTLMALGSLVLILCIAFTVVQLTAGETAWFEREFFKLNLGEQMGMTLGDLGASVRTLVDYMNGAAESIDLLVTVDGQQMKMFALDIEVIHMTEVRALWQWFVRIRGIGLILALVLYMAGVVLDRKGAMRNFCVGYFWAFGTFLVILAFGGTWAAFSFDGFWTAFHRLIFPNSENWLLPAESRMIQMLPSELFRDLVMRMGGRMLAIFLGLTGLCVLLLVFRQRRMQAAVPTIPQPKEKTVEAEASAVQGPDLLIVHKKANMTVTERRKLNEELDRERQEKEDAAILGNTEPPEDPALKIEFAPYAGPTEPEKKPAEEDDDYDELF